MKQWILYPELRAVADELSAAQGLSRLLANTLVNRGIRTPAAAEKFLNPKLAQLQDPFGIPQIAAAAARVWQAKERGEKTVVYGDYDVDGVSGTAILVQTLRFLGLDVDYYIPHRYGEGYSLSTDSVRKIAAQGTKLIITVDCGISSVEEVELASQLGLEVVVTDHHNLPAQLPAARAIVNPKQITGEHPSKYLSGAGVAFKFAWALLRVAGVKDGTFLTSLLDLAALGTFSDVVPLTEENRIIAVGGLNLINARQRLGIKCLAEVAALKERITAEQIYFGLAPRLNAAGRLEHAAQAVELLLSDEPDRARALAGELSRINSRRQDIGSTIREEVFARLDEQYVAQHKLLLLDGQNWHPGVIGIVASQVAETFSRPTVLIGINEGVGRGSARSVEGVNIYELLNTCQDLFLDFGGHEGAAGFEIEPALIPELRRRLQEMVDVRINPEELVAKVMIDAEIEPAQITLGVIKELERLAPFGEGNPAPLFMLRELELTDHKKVGKAGRHFKAWFKRDGASIETIGFGLGAVAGWIDPARRYDIAFELGTNTWDGFESAQLSLIDIRES